MSEDVAELSERERRFVEAYAGEAAGNGVRAAELAGYAGEPHVLATQAWRLLRKADIRAALEAMVESDALAATRIERIRRLSQIVRGEVSEWKAITGGEMAGQLIELPTSPQAITAAIKELGLLAGDYVTKVAQTNGQGEDLATMPLEQLFALAGQAKP